MAHAGPGAAAAAVRGKFVLFEFGQSIKDVLYDLDRGVCTALLPPGWRMPAKVVDKSPKETVDAFLADPAGRAIVGYMVARDFFDKDDVGGWRTVAARASGALRTFLKEAGYEVWYQPDDTHGGSSVGAANRDPNVLTQKMVADLQDAATRRRGVWQQRRPRRRAGGRTRLRGRRRRPDGVRGAR